MTQVQHRTLWLSIRSDAENWLFEIGPHEERAIVVGTLLRAHVRIDARGIKPVHLQFERDGNGLRVIPALGAEIHINGELAKSSQTLEPYARIEFSGLKLEAYVFDAEPDSLERLQLREWARRELQYRSEPGTTLARDMCAPEVGWHDAPASSSNLPTETFRPFCDVWLNAPGAVLESDRNATTQASTPTASSITEPQSLSPATHRPVPLDNTPPPAPSRAWFQVTRIAPTPTPTPSSLQFLSDDFRNRSRAALGRLGLLARDKPVLVALAAITGATTLMLAMLGIRQCVLLLSGDHLVVHQYSSTPATSTTTRDMHPTGVATPPLDSWSGVSTADVADQDASAATLLRAPAIGARNVHRAPKPTNRSPYSGASAGTSGNHSAPQ